MGVLKQPLNQNRQPNQRRPYNSGDSDFDDDDSYYSRNNSYNSNNYNSKSYDSSDYDSHDDDDGDGD